MTDTRVEVVGGGPAGAAAAISAALRGADVTLYEKAHLPRHKVCGEFLSPEAVPVLDRLGVWTRILAAGAVPINRLGLRFGRGSINHRLEETAYGISRFTLDRLLLDAVGARGVAVVRKKHVAPSAPAVLATGRRSVPAAPGADRLFGFKAHFAGPISDSVVLHFFDDCYVGVSPVENSVTNVCGLAPESVLRRVEFQFDELLERSAALSERLRPLSRTMNWLAVGPLSMRNSLREVAPEGCYAAGDALSFIDPFTGSGMYSAMLTGHLAGLAAAARTPAQRLAGDGSPPADVSVPISRPDPPPAAHPLGPAARAPCLTLASLRRHPTGKHREQARVACHHEAEDAPSNNAQPAVVLSPSRSNTPHIRSHTFIYGYPPPQPDSATTTDPRSPPDRSRTPPAPGTPAAGRSPAPNLRRARCSRSR